MFTVHERTIGTAACLDVGGQLLGESAAAQLGDTVSGLLQRGFRQIVINLEGVTRIDSCGLGGLISARNAIEGRGSSVCLVRLTHRLHDLLVITGLLTHFECFDSEADAGPWLASRPAGRTVSRSSVGVSSLSA